MPCLLAPTAANMLVVQTINHQQQTSKLWETSLCRAIPMVVLDVLPVVVSPASGHTLQLPVSSRLIPT